MEREASWSSVLYGFPVGGLATETICAGLYLMLHGTWTFLLILSSICMLLLGCWFYRKATDKLVFLIAALCTALLGLIGSYLLVL